MSSRRDFTLLLQVGGLFAVAVLIVVIGAAARPDRRAGVVECAHPPAGVIRVALSTNESSVELYEWSGTDFRRTGAAPLAEYFYRKPDDGSYYIRDHWGQNAPTVRRDAAGPYSILSTPYATSRDRRRHAIGVEPKVNELDLPPTRFAVFDAGASTPVRVFDVGQWIDSLWWSPSALEIVVLSEVERYGRETFRDWVALAAGHPIPYSDVKLTTYGLDGTVRCSTYAALSLPYGGGRVRWDAQ